MSHPGALVPPQSSGRVPINLIAGPLGVGKTTTINHLLAHRPRHERWAVLVNEYGLIGLDEALLEGGARAGGVEIREVAGGCICCTAGLMFQVSLMMLLDRQPDRLLIEPTGLAAVSSLLDTLSRPGIKERVDVRSVVCLVDPATLHQEMSRAEVQDQIEAADVLLANRVDQASVEQLAGFQTWGEGLFPPKRCISQMEQGRIPMDLLDLVSGRGAPEVGAPEHRAEHHHPHHVAPEVSVEDEALCDATQPIVQRSHRPPFASSLGWICWPGLVFDADRVSCWLSQLTRSSGALRAKAVLRTNEGWWGFNFARDLQDLRPSAHRRDSRLELVFDGDSGPDPAALELGLRACLAGRPIA